MYFIYTLLTAWLLTKIDLDQVLLSGFNEVAHTNYSINVYWLFFVVVGLLLSALDVISSSRK